MNGTKTHIIQSSKDIRQVFVTSIKASIFNLLFSIRMTIEKVKKLQIKYHSSLTNGNVARRTENRTGSCCSKGRLYDGPLLFPCLNRVPKKVKLT